MVNLLFDPCSTTRKQSLLPYGFNWVSHTLTYRLQEKISMESLKGTFGSIVFIPSGVPSTKTCRTESPNKISLISTSSDQFNV